MHCPSCGAMTTAGLRFCKQCGGDLERFARPSDSERAGQNQGRESTEISVRKLAPIFWSVAIFSMVSLVVLFGISVPLTLFGASRGFTVPLYMFGSAAVVLIAGMLIRQVSRLIKLMEEQVRAARPAALRAAEANPPQIAAPPSSFRSVTEHTTRNFEPVYREPSTHE